MICRSHSSRAALFRAGQASLSSAPQTAPGRVVTNRRASARPFLAFALAALLGACATIPVGYDFDPQADFQGLQSYTWIEGERKPTGDPRIDGNSLLEARIRDAVDRALVAKGYVKDTTAQPDFLIDYYVTLDKRASVQTINRYFGYGPGWAWYYGGYYAPYAWSDTYVYEYDEGTLILDVVSPQSRQLIWRGSGTDEVGFVSTPEQRQDVLNRMAEAILANFPPTEKRTAPDPTRPSSTDNRDDG